MPATNVSAGQNLSIPLPQHSSQETMVDVQPQHSSNETVIDALGLSAPLHESTAIEKPWGYLEALSGCYKSVSLTDKIFAFGREENQHLINPKLMTKCFYSSMSRKCFTLENKPDGTIELIDHSRIGVTISDTKQDNEEFLGKGHSYDIYDEDIISLGANHMVYMFKLPKSIETTMERRQRNKRQSFMDETLIFKEPQTKAPKPPRERKKPK